MKFLVDAQLPRRLARLLTTLDHDAIHTLDLPSGNKTPDEELLEICAREDRVLISKDLDFANSFVLNRQPPHLLLITTGNITNAELDALVRKHLTTIIDALSGAAAFVELARLGQVVWVSTRHINPG